jgi:hypothetical protein
MDLVVLVVMAMILAREDSEVLLQGLRGQMVLCQ